MINIFIPSLVLLFIIYLTNYLPSFYIDSILICTISILFLTTLLIYHSQALPHTPHIKMSDIWLLAVHIASFVQILLLVRLNYLSLEEEVCQRKISVGNHEEYEEELQRRGIDENYLVPVENVWESAKVINH